MGTLLLYPSNERHPFNTIKMKAFVAVLCSAAAASGATIAAIPAPVIPATTIVRAPAHDSATIESHRLGGNFAYAAAEAHAFAKVSPQLATRTVPVAETTHIQSRQTPERIQEAMSSKATVVDHSSSSSFHHTTKRRASKEVFYRSKRILHTTFHVIFFTNEPIFECFTCLIS